MISNMHQVKIDEETYIPLDRTIVDLNTYLTNEMKDLPASLRDGYEMAQHDVLCHMNLYKYKAESEPQPKGHWEETRYRSYDSQSCETYDDGVGFRCSNCANVFKVTSLARYHYCPDCGCRMSEVSK